MIRAEVAGALAVLDAGKSYPQKLAYALAKGRIQLKRIAHAHMELGRQIVVLDE